MTRHKIMIRKWKYDQVGQDVGRKKTGEGPNEISAPLEHLEELRTSDYKISEEHPEIYGWKVIDPTGNEIGTVKNFLFDRGEEKIRYIVTSLKEGKSSKEEKFVLIPIGRAKLDQEEKRVLMIQKVSSEELSDLPDYKNVKSLAIEDEKKTLSIFSNTDEGELDYSRENFYSRDDFSEIRFFDS